MDAFKKGRSAKGRRKKKQSVCDARQDGKWRARQVRSQATTSINCERASNAQRPMIVLFIVLADVRRRDVHETIYASPRNMPRHCNHVLRKRDVRADATIESAANIPEG